ncbi:N-acetylmuramoyl-L-alanine amidase [Paenisporosarcina sp. FSL H8-0542]|uniref:N-acetylmuramoyl-L-alanine amidase family protein n=1 Tax=Paenisporosarcina sp. FSL H8-0542 TaxID=2921401 RepID=UPI003159C39B
MRKRKNKNGYIFLLVMAFIVVFSIIKLQGNGMMGNNEGLAKESSVKIVNSAEASSENKVKTTTKILTGKTIVIDPGHGGGDIGASGQNGTIEKDVTLTMSKNIQNNLEERTGATVILTRKDDVKVSLEDRVKVAEEENADLFVSIHFDAFFTNDVEGITTYYNNTDEPIAKLIHENIFKNGLDARNRGVRLGDLYVLRENSRPAILLELGFISNSKDEARMTSEEFQKNTANSIVDGIIDSLR